MKIKRTIELQSGRGDVLTEQNKNDYILVVGSMFKAGELTDDPDLLLDGGLIGNADTTKAVVDSQGFDGINAYTVPELVDVMCGATDVDMADLMVVLIKHSSFKDLSAALNIADAWQSNITKENTQYTTAPKGMMSMVGEDDPVAEPMPLPRVEPRLNDEEDIDGINEILSDAVEASEAEMTPEFGDWDQNNEYYFGDRVRARIYGSWRTYKCTATVATKGVFIKHEWSKA